jgi:hypothetical protein
LIVVRHDISLPTIDPSGVISEFSKKSASLIAIAAYRREGPQKKGSAIGGACFTQTWYDAWFQRPKNNHNKMITGIGTPRSQSKIPRPIIASINSSDGFKNATQEARFRLSRETKISEPAIIPEPSASRRVWARSHAARQAAYQ